MLSLFTLLLLAGVLIAPATAKEAPVFNELPAREGYVRLYLYRAKHFVGSGIRPVIRIDGVEIGKLVNGGCMALYLRPGVHSLETKLSPLNYPLKGGTAEFKVSETSELYVLYTTDMSASEKPGYVTYRNGFFLPDIEYSKATIKASIPIPLDPDVLVKKTP